MADVDIHSPHDTLVRSILSRKESAIAYLKSQLPPALVRRIDWDTLERQQGSYVTEKMRALHSDMVFLVMLAGTPLYLYCLLEHQSRVESLMVFRLLEYIVAFLREWLNANPGARKLPAVVPLVLYHGGEPWTPSPRMVDAIAIPEDLRGELERFQPSFEHLLLDLSQVDADGIAEEIVTRTMLTLLKAASEGSIESWIDRHGDYLLEVLKQENGRGVMSAFLRYMCRSGTGATFSTVSEKLARLNSPKLENEIMTIADELMLVGEKRGLERGREQGLLIGRIQLWEEILGRDVSSRDSLGELDVETLRAMEASLRSEHVGSR